MLALLSVMATNAQELATGGQFMDLLLPMEGSVPATADDWGTTAGENTQYNGTWEGTLGRWKDNGIEDTERSYWGGNIVQGDDGKYHIYVAGWPSDTKGHMAWSSASRVYHVISDNVWGPYTYVSDIGSGHNPEIYKTGDTYVIYRIEPLGYYKSTTLGDAWETGEYTFDLRDRILIAGENRETSLSNCSFAKREDGSFVMIDRGGGIWVSRDGLADPWHQLTDASVYLNSTVKTRGSLEDPVIWRDHLQYHMVVNDWSARYAYYYRSKDGLHWVMEAGKAYTGQDPFAKHADGTVEKWHKYERPRVYQDEQGRAIRMNFAVIDCVKQSDLAGDDHSSKNINMPITRQLLLEVQGSEPITPSTTTIRVLVKAEDGFNPRTDLTLSSLKFGSHDKVNYGGGFSYASSEASGTSDLIITFTGTAGQSGITADEWAPKMLGQMADGSIAFGYARMPGVDYKPAILSAVTPVFSTDGTVQAVNVSNYGQNAATATAVRVYSADGNTLLAHGTTSALAAYASETIALTKDAVAKAGYMTIRVCFYDGETLLNTENIPLTVITTAQTALQAVIAEAETLYADEALTIGKADLSAAIAAAKAVVTTYSVADIETQQKALTTALNTYTSANASPTNVLRITVPTATMDDLSAWTLTRLDATETPGWKLNAKGDNYAGFSGNFLEYWCNQNGALGYANRASQTLTDMPAGRYRLRAQVIACRQNNGNATTGVTLFANGEKTDCKTANNTPQEFMVEIRLTEAGPLTIGIDIPATTEANWVAWDNVSLKYFGTAEGDIVEEEPEPVVYTIDPTKAYELMHFNTNRPRYMKAMPSADNVLSTTNEVSERGHFCFIPVDGKEGYYYIYETREQHYVVPSTGKWTLSATTPAAVRVTSNEANASSFVQEGTTWLLGESNQHANPQQTNGDEYIKAYSDHPADRGNNWQLIEVGDAAVTATVTASGFATFVPNCALDFSETGIKAYTVKVKREDGATDAVAMLTQVDKVPAKTPVLLYKEGGAEEAVTVIADAAPVGDNDLLAGEDKQVSTIDGEYTNMILNNVDGIGFYFANNQFVASNRAYLHIKTELAPNAASGARMMISFGDETTGIAEIAKTDAADGAIYNLSGQRVSKPACGLYVVNGKKVMIK